ncbi:AraC family transcriptional regulator [Kordiimonas laminariae]|uniref:AraC family transcriptional regulator n=1 Tax=Kordiimonas laminariae TaxID=2917717 RepID=UPI001FF40AC7|nr:AraC family transcriptional regulator [Kordiimonas laminariae]MCK0068715.1 AraC family transcriptional regulator [Kordiimonas laminariae]
MDVFSDILDLVKFQGCLYFTTCFTNTWGVEVPAFKKVARFHYIEEGECWVSVDGADPVQLLPGDFIIIPNGSMHLLRNHPSSKVYPLTEVLEDGSFDETGRLTYSNASSLKTPQPATRLICGHLEFDDGYDHPLFAQLPPFILIKGKEAKNFSWFDQALKMMTLETNTKRPGHDAIEKRLSEILFLHAIRVWIETSGGPKGFAAAVLNPQIGRSLSAMHNKPERKWTVESMAHQAGMSRTVFSCRFSEIMGLTPMQYLTQWRVLKAQRLLTENNVSVEWVAAKVGYESVAAFSRVFKRHTGKGPGAHRKAAKEIEVAA